MSLNTFAKINRGLVAIIARKNQILINNTTANAIRGKTNPAATATLIIIFPKFFPIELVFEFESLKLAKSIIDA
ncbi:TPA: hypothetical protein DIC40_05825 [Patescibacteria group bacterium]|nr:hypothetical protein [Candidatus Gracilibacteria bacterium]